MANKKVTISWVFHAFFRDHDDETMMISPVVQRKRSPSEICSFILHFVTRTIGIIYILRLFIPEEILESCQKIFHPPKASWSMNIPTSIICLFVSIVFLYGAVNGLCMPRTESKDEAPRDEYSHEQPISPLLANIQQNEETQQQQPEEGRCSMETSQVESRHKLPSIRSPPLRNAHQLQEKLQQPIGIIGDNSSHKPQPSLSSPLLNVQNHEHQQSLTERNDVHTTVNAASVPIVTDHPSTHDVLCGRGGLTNGHPGNRRFRDLIAMYKTDYAQSTFAEKSIVSKRIIKAIREGKPPGRFLKKSSPDGKWYDIGDKFATEKAAQALRERPAKRKLSPVIAAEEAVAKKRASIPKPSGMEHVGSPGFVRPCLGVTTHLNHVSSLLNVKEKETKKPKAQPTRRRRVWIVDKNEAGESYEKALGNITVTEFDVICGRGSRATNHPGNKRFRNIVLKHRDQYFQSAQKHGVAHRIVSLIRNDNHPGRFLKQDESGQWYDIGNMRAAEKAAQAFREIKPRKAPPATPPQTLRTNMFVAPRMSNTFRETKPRKAPPSTPQQTLRTNVFVAPRMSQAFRETKPRKASPATPPQTLSTNVFVAPRISWQQPYSLPSVADTTTSPASTVFGSLKSNENETRLYEDERNGKAGPAGKWNELSTM